MLPKENFSHEGLILVGKSSYLATSLEYMFGF